MKNLFHTEETNLLLKSAISLNHIATEVKYYYCGDGYPDLNSFDFGSEKENKEYLKRFDTGELLNLTLFVEVSCLGESGSDVLGAVHVNSRNIEKDLLEMAIEHDMKNNACRELRDNILRKHAMLKKVLG